MGLTVLELWPMPCFALLLQGSIMFLQRTIRERVKVNGVGLHTGKPASLTFCPAPASSGIHFVRRDLPDHPSLQVHAKNVTSTNNATTLGGSAFSVSTVEHCLSAMSALRIDNLIIELDGPEIPIVDGSARPYLEALLKVGLADQDEPRKYAYVTKPIYFGDDEKHAFVQPYNGLRITCTIDFQHSKIGRQTMDVDVNMHTFKNDISGARTFGFLKDVEFLHSKGLALGGSLQNAVVLDAATIMNPEGLRFTDEFVRHKVLDALGDLTTLGAPLLGHLTLFKAGHDIMNKLINKILETPDACKIMELAAPIDETDPRNDFRWMTE